MTARSYLRRLTDVLPDDPAGTDYRCAHSERDARGVLHPCYYLPTWARVYPHATLYLCPTHAAEEPT